MRDYKRVLRRIRYCSACGKKIVKLGLDEKSRLVYLMNRDNICYDCAYWEELIEYPPRYMEVLGEKCIKVCPMADSKDKTLILGGKGKTRYFMRNNQDLLCSNDIWTIGDIPERFRPRLPATLREITKTAYKKLSRTTKTCNARACFDRYYCFRYNLALEDGKGAFNKVPGNWKIGGEHCGFFIDKDNVYI